MKKKLAVPEFRPLADFLPTITIKAKDFANEITNFNIKQNGLSAELPITDEHVKNNAEVRRLLVDRGIVPEALPPAEDVKKSRAGLRPNRRSCRDRSNGLKAAQIRKADGIPSELPKVEGKDER